MITFVGPKNIAIVVGALLTLLSGTIPSQANLVTVQDLNINPSEVVNISVTNFYTGNVYAGVNKLLVSGTAMDGFCIDPYHFSSTSPLVYSVVPLKNAPKAPGTMNATQATQIGNLWAMYYSSAMTASTAAGMQIAIWEIVAGSQFSITGSDYGASTMLSKMTAYTGAGADLVGLTGPGQDYVVRRTNALSTPDQGSTLALLSVGVAALLAVGRFQGTVCRRLAGVR